MAEELALTVEQSDALAAMGIQANQLTALLRGDPTAYALPTESEHGVGIIRIVHGRLESGILAVKDPGGGVKTLARFRGASQRVARAFSLAELELFGAEIINAELREMLLRRGFQEKSLPCPEELGGGTMTVLTRMFPVRT